MLDVLCRIGPAIIGTSKKRYLAHGIWDRLRALFVHIHFSEV